MEIMDVITPQENVEQEINHTQNPPSSDSFRDMNFISLKGFFNVERPTVEEEEAMNWIYGQFEKMGATDMSEILLGIRDIEKRMVTPIGTPRAIAVKNYLKINSQIADLQGQREAMEI